MSVRVSHCRLVGIAGTLGVFVLSCADPFLHQLPEIPPLTMQVNGELITHIKTPVGELDRVRGEPGAVPSGVTEVRFWSDERGGDVLAFFTDFQSDGSFSELSLPSSAHLWISTVDKHGIERGRVYARKIEQTLNLVGRVPYSSYPTPVALYPFAADRDPREIHPATGALYGEASIGDSAAAAAQDGAAAVFAVGPQARNVPGDWSLAAGDLGNVYLHGRSAAYDAHRGMVVLFGGATGGTVLSKTWEYDGNTWTEVIPGERPSGRFAHAMGYDTARGVVVVFGGERFQGGWVDNELLADTWEYNGITWTHRASAFAPSPARDAPMVYDAGRGVFVLFGGRKDTFPTPTGQGLADTWEYDGDAWREVTPPTSPPPRLGHAMAYDSARGKTVLFGGFHNRARPRQDTWEYDGNAWIEVTPTTSPPTRKGHAMAYDSTRGKVVLFGGISTPLGDEFEDTWEWDGTNGNWTQVAPPHSPGSGYYGIPGGMVYDTNRAVTVLIDDMEQTWEYVTHTPHVRTAAHGMVFPLAAPDADIFRLQATYVGAGVGDDGTGEATAGVEVGVWDWAKRKSVILGFDRYADLIVASPPPPLSNYVNRGRIWLMATSLYPSSEPGGAGINSEIHTDYVELQVTYTIP
ncbi:kelch repeat-containing protein [Myxococcota bacterium]